MMHPIGSPSLSSAMSDNYYDRITAIERAALALAAWLRFQRARQGSE